VDYNRYYDIYDNRVTVLRQSSYFLVGCYGNSYRDSLILVIKLANVHTYVFSY